MRDSYVKFVMQFSPIVRRIFYLKKKRNKRLTWQTIQASDQKKCSHRIEYNGRPKKIMSRSIKIEKSTAFQPTHLSLMINLHSLIENYQN